MTTRSRVRRGLRVVALAYLLLALFERLAPRRLVRAFQKYVANPSQRHLAGLVPGFAVVETVGRRTGEPRRVPVGGAVRGGSFWLVAGDAGHSQYVKNIEADPAVRVKVHGRWQAGTAHACPEDDPRKRMFRSNPVNGLFLWIAGRDLLTIRIDLASSPASTKGTTERGATAPS